MSLLKIIILGGLSVLVITVLYKWYRCRQKGEESGKAFRCSLFSSEPTLLHPLREYNTMNKGKCYQIVDYGKSMSYKEVGPELCNQNENF